MAAAVAIAFPISLSPPLQCPRRFATPPACTHNERGVSFDPGSAFYRSDSAAGRDLAVLAATLNRRGRQDPAAPFLCLDAMCGCGVRALRYLAQAGADFVWANDASEALRPVILANLSRFGRWSAAPQEGGRRRWVVSHNDATRLLAERYLRREYFDIIDVDSFGGDSAYVRAALLALKIGGLLYLTSTDWRSARGYGTRSSLSSYGAYVRPMPYPNEIGLRMVIGGAAREASMLGFHIAPLFSYFAYHGPIYRVMVQLRNGKQDGISNYGFICHCKSCGQSHTFGFDELGQISCGCTDRTVGTMDHCGSTTQCKNCHNRVTQLRNGKHDGTPSVPEKASLEPKERSPRPKLFYPAALVLSSLPLDVPFLAAGFLQWERGSVRDERESCAADDEWWRMVHCFVFLFFLQRTGCCTDLTSDCVSCALGADDTLPGRGFRLQTTLSPGRREYKRNDTSQSF